MPDNEKYKITVNKNELQIINTALEWFFRVQMGQFFDYATEVAKDGYVYNKNNPENDKLFNEYINRRNESQELFEKAFRVAQPKLCGQTEDMMIAGDMWSTIRHFMWNERPEPKSHITVDAYKPMLLSGEEPIKVERVD